jgi:hypothetical protein
MKNELNCNNTTFLTLFIRYVNEAYRQQKILKILSQSPEEYLLHKHPNYTCSIEQLKNDEQSRRDPFYKKDYSEGFWHNSISALEKKSR